MMTNSEPRIVTPQEAQEMMRGEGIWQRDDDMAYTVATEPDRIRAAVVEALRDLGKRYDVADAYDMANAIEDWADY